MPFARGARVPLAVLLACSLFMRLGWCLGRGSSEASIDTLPDQQEYLALAQNLLHSGELRFFDKRFKQDVLAYRTPGYPLFVAALGANVRLVMAVQAVADVLTVLAAFLLARRLFPGSHPRGPLLAAALVAFNPFLIYFTGKILSETLFTSLLIWGMFFLCRIGSRGTLWLAAAALIFALAVLVRPSAILLPPLLGFASAWVGGRRHPPELQSREDAYQNRRRWAAYQAGRGLVRTALLSIVLVAALTPWAWRNHRVLGRWIWTTTNGGVTLYDGFHPDATGASDQSFLRGMPELRRMSEVQRDDHLKRQAYSFIRAHPGQAVMLGILKMARTWSPVPLSRQFGGWRNRVVGLSYAMIFDLTVVAAVLSKRSRPSAKVFLLVPAIYFTAVHMLSVGSLRYRVPVEPPMAVVGAALACRRADKERALPQEAVNAAAVPPSNV